MTARPLLTACALALLVSCRGGRPHGNTAPIVAEEKIFGSYSVPGLAESELRPLVILTESSAWSGSPEGLPSVVVYESGLVIRAESGPNSVADLQSGKLENPLELARDLEALGLAKLGGRLDLSGATDQPEVTLSYRIGNTWRSTTVVGLHRDESIPAKEADVPSELLAGYRKLRNLSMKDAHPFTRTAYVVHLWDAEMSPGAALPWPPTVPPPPKLVPDTRYLGNPRSYSLSGEPGLVLFRFVRAVDGGRPPMRTPSGDTVAVWVTSQIPDQGYIAHVEKCRTWEKAPYHECTEPRPGL